MTYIIDDLIADIKNTPGFQDHIESFIVLVLKYLFNINCSSNTNKTSTYSLKQLLEIASIFSLSEKEADRSLAYLISTYCWLMYNNQNPEIASIVKLIMSRIGNFPAQNLIKVLDENYIPKNIFMDLENIGLKSKNKTSFIKNLVLTDFQAELWNYLEQNQSISFSAPTSSGKSFILKKYSIKKMKDSKQGLILYILPSRALINETTTDLLNFLKEENMQNEVLVTSIPTEKSSSKKIIYVLTQERATLLIEEKPNIYFDLVIVDEAQSIENSQRGIILQNIVNTVLEKNINTPIIFSSPFVENLDIFNMAFRKDIKILPSKRTNVIQNLISVNFIEDKMQLTLVGDLNQYLGDIPLKINYYDISEKKNRLAYMAKYFTSNCDKSIIYANGPAEAEDIAQLLYDQLPPIQMSDTLKELSKYIKSHLHTKFSLALMLEHGVAFHYGNLPHDIRKNIEDEFKRNDGQIKYLVCTSTLLEGVNLPAKNIFIENPYKGKEKGGIPLSEHEFWNLAGRAGRLTKDLYGNVFLVNYSSWNNHINSNNKNKKISIALFDTINNEVNELIEYADSKIPARTLSSSVESSINVLYTAYKKNGFKKLLSNKLINLTEDTKCKLHDSIEHLSNSISLPIEITKQNPYISIINQQKLYNYFVEKNSKGELDTCLPKHPKSKDTNNLRKVFYRINKYFWPKEQQDSMKKHIREVTPNASIWMQGLPIRLMINNYIEHKQKEAKRAVDINACVRHILDIVEKDIRFKLAVATKCYNDILTYYYDSLGIEKKIEPIHLYLEMGACNQTMISLMGIGLSRPTAATIEEKIFNKNLDEDEVYVWLKNNKDNMQEFKITGLTLDEINTFLG